MIEPKKRTVEIDATFTFKHLVDYAAWVVLTSLGYVAMWWLGYVALAGVLLIPFTAAILAASATVTVSVTTVEEELDIDGV